MAKKILLADDSITIQKVISITFASEDYDLIIVGDGDSALKKAKEAAPDLVMADVAMPGKTGYEVCESLKKDPATSQIPVMLLAGTFEPLDKGEAVRVGADDSIVKPFESQELLDKVRELLSKGAGIESIPTLEEAIPSGKEEPAGLEIGEDIWEAGDFLGLPDDFGSKPEKGTGGLEFLGSDIFEEPSKDFTLPQEAGFSDLEFKDEEEKKEAELPPADTFEIKEEAFRKETFEEPSRPPFRVEEFEVEEFKAPPVKEEEPFELETFDRDFKAEPAPKGEEEPFELETFEPETKPEVKEEAKEEKAEEFFWEEPREERKKEAPSEAFEEKKEEPLWAVPEIEPERKEEPPTPERGKVLRPEFPAFETKPIREILKPEPVVPQPVAGISEEEVASAVERAVAAAEERFREMMDRKAAQVEEQALKAVEGVSARLEAKLRDDLAVKLGKAESQASQAVESAAAKTGERLARELSSSLEKRLSIPREQAEEIVRKSAKEVIEAVAWEVIPQLSEQLIKAEIAKFKEVLAKLR